MKALIAPLAAAFVLSAALPSARAQHAGHAHHATPAVPVAEDAAPEPTSRTPTADHAAMGHDLRPTQRADESDADPGTAHGAMHHGAMHHGEKHHAEKHHRAMDHSAMDHGTAMPGDRAAAPSSPMNHAATDHGTAPALPADAAPRTPIPVLTDADRAAAFPDGLHGHATHDRRIHSYWLADRVEWQDGGAIAWEGVAWIGGDIHRLWLRSEGEAADGEVEHGDVEVLYGRSITPWWDGVAGVRTDLGHGPSRTWAAFGVQGLAPYKFEVEATAYVGDNGRTAATVEIEYDTLVARRLVLQWQAGASAYGRDDPAAGVGSGLSTIEAGARLRYEFSRRFAPYVGVQVERAFGGTAELRRADGDSVRDTRLVAGLRLWF